MSNKRRAGVILRFFMVPLVMIVLFMSTALGQRKERMKFFPANHPLIQYTGRIDYSNPAFPKGWMPGIYMKALFTGTSCSVLLQDEMLYGVFHNYFEIAIDNNPPLRWRLTGKQNELEVAKGLSPGEHILTICKNTEAGIGFMVFAGLKCKGLKRLPPKPSRKIEFFGNSITCGTGSDQSVVPCGKGAWQDQHNAYMSYGAVTARALQAEYHLSAVSGIGLMHSCCDLKITMPQVYDKINMVKDSLKWNFKQFVPQVVAICLGQNDGIQDSATFCNNYIGFIKKLRSHYPKATIICLTSPMADEKLLGVMKKNLTSIVNTLHAKGDSLTHKFFFSRRYHNGCDGHPDLAEHQLMAKELTPYFKKLMRW